MSHGVPRHISPAWYLEHSEMAIARIDCPVCHVPAGQRCKRWDKKHKTYHGSQKSVHNLRAILAVQIDAVSA